MADIWKRLRMKREPPRVLVVDDEPDLCWALENILRPAGYAVTTTTKGVEALDLLAKEPYDVAFVDAKLTDADGLELAALIRQRNPHTAIVLISGYFYQEDTVVTEGMLNDLFVGFISKPFNLEEVRLMARRAVSVAKEEKRADGSHSSGRR
jgi:DNA-binding NtrC family response regulator